MFPLSFLPRRENFALRIFEKAVAEAETGEGEERKKEEEEEKKCIKDDEGGEREDGEGNNNEGTRERVDIRPEKL